RHSADVKQDDDAGCCEDSEEDEWDYVKVNSEEQQQQQQHEQESQPAPEKQPEESTPSDETTLPVEYSSSINSFAPEEPPQQENEVVQQQPVQEVEQQHFEEQQQQQEEEVEVNCEEEEQQQVEQTPAQESNKEEEYGAAEGRVVAEHHDEVAAVPNTNEPAAAVADILGDYAAESTVSESANEVDDVISSTGGETKEVVNLLNDFNEDVLPPAADASVCDTNSETVNEEETSEPVVPAYDLPSDSVNMEASMYGGSVGDQPLSPETPMSPVENFPAQQQQQQYGHEKDMFGSGMDDTMSPTTDGEELNEKHLYETEEKSMNLLQQEQQQQQDGSGGVDYGWSLNPEAKEFVPVTGSVGGGGADINPKMHELREDAIVAQSPRKGTMSSMEDLDVPAETDFQTEMDKRPHEFEEYGGENGENGGADESGAGESHLRSPLAVHPFDLSEFNEQTVVEQQLLAGSGDMANGVGDYENAGADLLTQPAVADADAEMELLNKVQELPDDEEEKPQEPLVDAQEVAPLQAQYANEEFDQLVKPEETYSAKEELSVEQKETVDISPSSVDLAHQMDNLMLEGGEMYHGRVEDYPADQVPRGASSDISQSPEFKMLQSSIEQQLGKTSGSSSPFAGGESELAAYHKEASALEASVYDPEPGLLSSQEPAASDSAATKSAATRVGSSSTTTAARKPLAKAPTSSSGPAAARTTTGKPSTDAAKAAPATKTTASSVAAARTKAASATSTTKTATTASSTTKAASASSVTRTAAPKPATGSAAPKPSSRLSTASSTTTRTVTSRPSSAVSSASVPSKTSTTTTTTAKRTVAAKSSLTNGTSATDGAATRTTKTTTSSTVPRTGTATRTSATTGSGLAGKTSSSSTTAAAKKPLLDAKTTASKTASSSTAAGRTTTTTRTSLAPKAATAGVTSPSVRKVQQNGVAAKKSTTSAVSPAPGTKKPAPITRPKGTATTAAAAPAAAKTNGVVGTVTEAAVPVDAAPVAATSPPEQPEQQLPADQLLVPVPQAM
uniref:Ataxin-2 C-terminal domain-containing protein n=1 Tax=Anopheles melas TaxID=34690 RepID=A0A182UHF8_9DIPT